MDDTDAYFTQGRISLSSDHSVIARRRRMEIRKFKKMTSSTQLYDDDDSRSLESSVVCLKRPCLGQALMYCMDSASATQEIGNLTSILVTDEAKVLPHSKSKEAIMPDQVASLIDLSLPRHKSLPPMNILVNNIQRRRPDTDVDRGHYSESKGNSAEWPPKTLKQQIADSSSSEALCSISSPSARSGLVDVTKHLENERAEFRLSSCRALLENGAKPLGPFVGTPDVEMINAANESSSHEGVRVFASSNFDSSRQAPSNCNFPPSGKLLLCGRRREMEDAALIVPSFTHSRHDEAGSCLCDKEEGRPLCDLHFFAVYDGHGGSQASNFCLENLHHALAEELASIPECTGKPPEGSFSSSAWEKAMTSCFFKMDREVGGVCPNGVCDDVDKPAICCSNSVAPENVGTTAVVAVVSLCQIVVANCGDSRAVLSRGGLAIPLSRDHKPNRDDECSRIKAAGGQVIHWDGHRVGGLLALSRAIGDRYLKRYVISEPEVACLQRTQEDECLILASDGLWDVITNDIACEIARKCLHSSRKKRVVRVSALGEDPACAAVAALLIKLAYGRGSKDNISVVVIDLKV